MSSLYERLGGTEGITAIASDLVDLHLRNPRIAPRYVESDIPRVKNAAATFFISGTGGPSVYDGKDMLSAHRGMKSDIVHV
jgi:hemoglobin